MIPKVLPPFLGVCMSNVRWIQRVSLSRFATDLTSHRSLSPADGFSVVKLRFAFFLALMGDELLALSGKLFLAFDGEVFEPGGLSSDASPRLARDLGDRLKMSA